MSDDKRLKHILIFSLAYYPKHVGGAEVAIKEITDRIDPTDIVFHMICLRFDSNLPKEEQVGSNVNVHRIGPALRGTDTAKTHSSLFYFAKILYVPLAVLAVVRLSRTMKFDGLWAMMGYMMFPIVIARWFGVRTPYVVTLQEGDPLEHVFGRWYIRPFVPLMHIGFRNASVIQPISTFLAHWAREREATCPIEVIPNGVNVRHFSKGFSEESLQQIRNELGKEDDQTWLVHTGRYVHKNGLDTVISALASTPEQVHFLCIGEGPEEEKLRALAHNCGVQGRVHFHPYVDLQEVPKYLHACDIFIRPSRSEGMGNSFVEAMAAGLPVIATQEGGLADFIFDAIRNPEVPTTGWVVDAGNSTQIAEAINAILTNPEKVERVTQTARTLVQEKYDWDLVAKNMRERVFDRLTATQITP